MIIPVRPSPFRSILVLFGVCSAPLALTAQDFAPFNAGSRKLFASVPDHAATFSLAFDSTVVEGGMTHYYNFFAPADT